MAIREDFRLPMARPWQLLLLGVAFGLALALGAPGTVSAQEGTLAADCEGSSLAIDSDCEFGDGQEFTVAIQVTSAPDGGYFGYQAKLSWDADILDYLPTSDPGQEVVWSACAIPVRAEDVPGDPPGTSALFGCVRLELQATDYTGPLTLLTFVCTGQGTGSLTLEGGTEVSFFLEVSLQPINPSLEGASVTCGGPEQPRPPPEVVVNPPPPLDEATPQPPDETTPGDPIATPGPTVTPGGPSVTPGATVVGTPTLEQDAVEDDDDDGGGLPAWGWTLIGLAIAAGVGGGGFVAWRRLRARGEGAEPDEPQARGEGEEPDEPS